MNASSIHLAIFTNRSAMRTCTDDAGTCGSALSGKYMQNLGRRKSTSNTWYVELVRDDTRTLMATSAAESFLGLMATFATRCGFGKYTNLASSSKISSENSIAALITVSLFVLRTTSPHPSSGFISSDEFTLVSFGMVPVVSVSPPTPALYRALVFLSYPFSSASRSWRFWLSSTRVSSLTFSSMNSSSFREPTPPNAPCVL